MSRLYDHLSITPLGLRRLREFQVQYYTKAIQLDQYFAIAYFQTGVSNFLLGDFEEALANFNDTLLYLRGNGHIDYDQLGLKYKLHSCEALFNRGLCYVYLQATETGLQDMLHASKEKVPGQDHSVIDEAIRDRAEVSFWYSPASSQYLTRVTGLHRLFNPRWDHLSSF